MLSGLTNGLGLGETVKAFTDGLGGNATVAVSYALLGAFAAALTKTGLPDAMVEASVKLIGKRKIRGKSTVKSVNRTDYFNHILFLAKRGARSHCVYSGIDSAAFKNI